MPYIICVNQPGCLPESDPTAVATLEDARTSAVEEIDRSARDVLPDDEYDRLSRSAFYLPESGGVIGPLPDGYAIDVRKVSGVELARLAGLTSDDPAERFTLPAILDAYNHA